MPNNVPVGLQKITVPPLSRERELAENESQVYKTNSYPQNVEKNVTEFFSKAPVRRILLAWGLGLLGWLIVNESYNDYDWPWKYSEYIGIVPPG